MALNEVKIEGTLTREPATNQVNGKTVLNFGIAYNTRTKDANGNYVDGEPMFFDVAFWTEKAQYWLQRLGKGTSVVICGSLKMDKWADKNDGSTRTKVSITAHDIYGRWLETLDVQNAHKNNNAGTSQPAPATTQPSAPSNTSPTYQQTTSNNPADPNFIPF